MLLPGCVSWNAVHADHDMNNTTNISIKNNMKQYHANENDFITVNDIPKTILKENVLAALSFLLIKINVYNNL